MAPELETAMFPEAVADSIGPGPSLMGLMETPAGTAELVPDAADDPVSQQPTLDVDVLPAAAAESGGPQSPAEASAPGDAQLRPRPSWATHLDLRTRTARADYLRRLIADASGGGSPDNGRGNASAPRAEASADVEKLSPSQQAQHLVDENDLLALLGTVESSPVRDVTAVTLQQIAGCVRRMAEQDLDLLTDSLFAVILGTAGDLLLRCRLVISQEIAKTDASSRRLPDLPCLLVEQGWLTRFEKLSRFVTEMSAARARIRHVTGLNEGTPRRSRRRGAVLDDPGAEMDALLGMAAYAPKPNGRGHEAPAAFTFP
ncbi:MAG: hypothetical protein V2A79_02890 [Planctomycetota bacterium]